MISVLSIPVPNGLLFPGLVIICFYSIPLNFTALSLRENLTESTTCFHESIRSIERYISVLCY